MLLRFFFGLLLLLLSATGQAQELPSATSPVDVILRNDGQEIPARVLVVTPTQIRYLALADSARRPTDTLDMARPEVFLVRYANGTKELMNPAAETPAPENTLVGLTATQRQQKGRADARKYYKPSKGVFWGTFGATYAGALIVVGPLAGIGTGVALGVTPPKRENLHAPQPELLNDADYYTGYRKQAQGRKAGKAAAGFGVALGSQVVLLIVILAALFSTH
ncbi:hypothetical protein F0P96_09650 [Hymenobacter busanensis]|uniref:Uncharacterized protein n=1 Tax=Hymenobacter busanensis TaxID=2607656 RepID=A0A7L4ZXV3_9BACT|nr:hypothetical protein [Hymenobacter busanensis]KAA9333232.1 hypothetical protein F0P96_09650 [Hymenobacter busanensis]QHJ08091.1 hypothetical protein GUY19_12670 [Hymenobacter busanensis]